jgi:hypothetical protein
MMMFNAGPGGPYMGRGDMADMMAMDGGMGDKDGRRGDKDHRGMPPGGSGAYLRPSHYQVRSPAAARPHPRRPAPSRYLFVPPAHALSRVTLIAQHNVATGFV